MTVTERLLHYVSFDTQSDESSETCPSTAKQKLLGEALVEEMRAMGIADARIDADGYVYGSVPGTPGAPAIGLIAHMDTSPDCSGKGIKPRIVEYTGGDIALNENTVLSPEDFPILSRSIGKHLIVTDGTTLLGADDKAGIAEILTAVEELLAEGGAHASLRIGFTPDEEIGRGADRFDLAHFGADYAYTVDGGTLGELEYENFNAASAVVTVHGRNVHPGSAKRCMVNAQLIAMEFHGMLPVHDRPEATEGYEGFSHLCAMQGEVELATLEYIIRDHDRASFEARKALFEIGGGLPERAIRRGNGRGRPARQLLQHARKDRAAYGHRRGGAAGHARCGRHAARRAHPRRHGRRAPVLRGASLPEPVHGRRELPRPVRVRPGRGHGGRRAHAQVHPAQRSKMIHKRGRSGGPVFFLAKNPGLWHNGQERKVQPVTSLTKRAIRASFLKLLNERPLNKITVKDIVEDCGINRNSFYYHYPDIPALAEEIVRDEAARIVQEYPTVDSLEQCLEIAVEFALQNRTAVLHLYNSASHEAYEHSLIDICHSVVGSYFDTAFAGKALPEADREVLVRFYQCECYGQIVLWMSQGMQADIVEQFRLLCHLRQGMMEEMVARCCEKS